MRRLRLAGIGCGGRTTTYMTLAGQMPERYEVVAAADPNAHRVERCRQAARNPAFRGFDSDAAILAEPQLADVMIIGTQDRYHVEPCLAAMAKGYDILLEKPVADNPHDVLRVQQEAQRLGRRVLVCHVLRYAPLYREIKAQLASGIIGEIVSIDAKEGVGPWHFAHSYTRGHWAVKEQSSPIIIAKSCHDLDILAWLVDRPCIRVASHGSLSHFTAANRPAEAPARCTSGCPVGHRCRYNALRYASSERAWLHNVMDGAQEASDDEIRAWLATSPWGRCVYACDNNVPDHQVVSLDFAGGCTATFSLSAFNQGRDLMISGTEGRLYAGTSARLGGDCDIWIQRWETGDCHRINVNSAVGGYEGHGGGDPGLINALYTEMTRPAGEAMHTSIDVSIESHLIGYAAEEARLSHSCIDMAAYRERIGAERTLPAG